ncbi:SULT6B1 [Branchiostoma lanceolatum]|uniref:Sulfotransferase n=1 Tax=Branchiostoma lanceolatum TaxID=7740 RepID=A0A8J9W4F7_BRALA|nr:SULT6B1 [Branchiostoma lanceolatum]
MGSSMTGKSGEGFSTDRPCGPTWGRCKMVKMTAMVYWNYEGTNFPYTVTKQTLEALPEYQIRDDDIVVVSYPRAGSNWLLEIIGKLLKAAGKTTESADSIITGPLEVVLACCKLPGYVTLADKPSPRLMKTSLPIQFAPRGISNPRNQVKVIVVMRNPKDTAVSFYHFNKKLCQLQGVEEPVSWGEFAQAFVSGKGIVGDWKTLFTAEENNAFDAWYERILGGTDIVFDFE